MIVTVCVGGQTEEVSFWVSWGWNEFDSHVQVSSQSVGYPPQYSWAYLVAQMEKNLCAIRETWGPSLGPEDPLEEGTATYPSVLAWRIPMDRGAWWVTFMGSQRAGHGWETRHSTARDGMECYGCMISLNDNTQVLTCMCVALVQPLQPHYGIGKYQHIISIL